MHVHAFVRVSFLSFLLSMVAPLRSRCQSDDLIAVSAAAAAPER